MNEIKFEQLPVFSKMFLSIARSIKKKKNNPILDYILSKSNNEFSPKIRLVTLADHMLQDSTPEDKEKLKATLGFTPQGKPAIVDQNVDRYISKKFRQSGSIGTVLKNLIEFDSIMVKTTEVSDGETSFIYDNVLDCHIDKNSAMPVFFLNKKEWKESKKIEYRKTKFTDAQYEELVNLLKAEVDLTVKIEEVSGHEISKFYKAENYSDSHGTGGNLFSSCMRGDSNTKCIKFYDKNPETMKMVVIKDKDKILGRAMLFLTNIGWCLERRYIAQDFMENWLIDYARLKNYHYKSHNDYSSQKSITLYNFIKKTYESKEEVLLSVKIDKTMDSGRYYPYMDSFDFLLESTFISNYYPTRTDLNDVYRIKNTGGSPEGLNNGYNFKGQGKSSSDQLIDSEGYHCYANPNMFANDFKGNKILKSLSSDPDHPEKNFCPYSEQSCKEFNEFNAKKD